MDPIQVSNITSRYTELTNSFETLGKLYGKKMAYYDPKKSEFSSGLIAFFIYKLGLRKLEPITERSLDHLKGKVVELKAEIGKIDLIDHTDKALLDLVNQRLIKTINDISTKNFNITKKFLDDSKNELNEITSHLKMKTTKPPAQKNPEKQGGHHWFGRSSPFVQKVDPLDPEIQNFDWEKFFAPTDLTLRVYWTLGELSKRENPNQRSWGGVDV